MPLTTLIIPQKENCFRRNELRIGRDVNHSKPFGWLREISSMCSANSSKMATHMRSWTQGWAGCNGLAITAALGVWMLVIQWDGLDVTVVPFAVNKHTWHHYRRLTHKYRFSAKNHDKSLRTSNLCAFSLDCCAPITYSLCTCKLCRTRRLSYRCDTQ